jgi:hypothetical protein
MEPTLALRPLFVDRPKPAARPMASGAAVNTASGRGLCFARFGRRFHLDEAAGLDVIDVAADRYVRRHERMLADAAHVLNDARRLILDRMPFDEMASGVAAVMMAMISSEKSSMPQFVW